MPWNQISLEIVHNMYFLYDSEWHRSSNLKEILCDCMNNRLKYNFQKFCENFQRTFVNGIHEINHFMNDITNKCD